MPPPVAALACLLIVWYLFWDEFRQADRQRISWAPFVWMFIAGSRFASEWLNLGSPQSLNAWEEGSPVDRAVFFSLIAWGVIVLSRRNINWSRLLSQNRLIALYLLYCLSSLLWTDEPFVLAKRWIKDLGNPIMALVLLTEVRPYEALATTLRRLSFVLLPLSVLFIKYFPELGRAYTKEWSLMYTGVAMQKNTLGMSCLITGIYFAWKLLQPRPGGRAAGRSKGIDFVLIGILAWLLYMANSQTSIACLIAATGVLLIARVPQVSSKPSRIVPLIAMAAVVYAILQETIGINAYILALMGRDATLTNRVNVWQVVGRLAGNALIGTGFMSFWVPERTAMVARQLGSVELNQAHNGYLEQYLNLGYVGVGFILAIMLTTLLSVRRHLDQDAAPALLRLCFLVTAVMYNYTEASFYGINNMWVLLLTASIVTTGAVAFSPPVMDTGVAAGRCAVTQKRGRWRVRRRRPQVMEPSAGRPTDSADAERAVYRWTARAAPAGPPRDR